MDRRESRRAWETEQRRFNFIRMWGKRYAHMKARHDGRSTNSSHANGKGILTKEEFFDWCKDFKNLSEFLALYFDYAESGFQLALSPSVDRIDPDKGYVADNIQWLSFSANCEKNHKYVDHRGIMVREEV